MIYNIDKEENMAMKLNAMIEVEPSEIEKLVKDYVEKETGRIVKNVTFNVKSICTGYGMAETYEEVFSGCMVNLEPYTE